MSNTLYAVAIAVCIAMLVMIELYVITPEIAPMHVSRRISTMREKFGIIVDENDNTMNQNTGAQQLEGLPIRSKIEARFSVIIVTYNEPLLYKTVHNVLENSNPSYLYEVLIIDDTSEPPVEWDPEDKRVRIVRSNERLGLIKARFVGGNEARGEYLAFIDAHVFVGPNWLTSPHRLLTENLNTTVNYVNFSLNKDAYTPEKAWKGIGSSASITADLHQFWGGGSRKDDSSPITMGMFATSKHWWELGRMDPLLKVWGGENVEISLRTWLCGGRIMVARDSFVAHAFRSKFPYPVNSNDVRNNYVRIANVWLEGKYLDLFYNASRIDRSYFPKSKIGDISERLELKKRLQCKPFSYYAEKFEGRAFCLPKWMQPVGYKCGTVMTVSVSSLNYLTHEQMFFKNATKKW